MVKPLAVRVSEDVQEEILKIAEQERLDNVTVVTNLLKIGIAEWWRNHALRLLEDGKLTFAKAAEVARLSLWEFSDLVRQHDVEWVKFAPEEVEREANKTSTANGATR